MVVLLVFAGNGRVKKQTGLLLADEVLQQPFLPLFCLRLVVRFVLYSFDGSCNSCAGKNNDGPRDKDHITFLYAKKFRFDSVLGDTQSSSRSMIARRRSAISVGISSMFLCPFRLQG